jgi:hypothetical protein
MTLGGIGSIGEAIGAAATVATLLYLALQIRANTTGRSRSGSRRRAEPAVGANQTVRSPGS